jgi:predicted MFS family arabinose efflux permease
MGLLAVRARSEHGGILHHDAVTRPGRLAFGVVLALAMGTSTFAGYAFGVLGPNLVHEFDISRSQLGLLTAVFFLVGGPLSLVAGPATDRFGARRVMLIAFAIAAATLVAMALAPAYPAMLVAAGLAGLALATGNPVTNKLVAVHLPPGTRGLVMGGKQAGVQVGAFVAGALLAPLAAQFGWRAALGWVALVPIAALVAAVVVVPSDTTSAVEPHDPAAHSSLPRGVRWLALYAFLMGSGVAAVNAYLPLYLVEGGEASQEMAGVVVATIGLVGIFSRLVWGWASERMPTFSLPLLMLGGGAVVAIGLILAIERVGLWVAWPAAILFGATAVTWNAVGNLAVITESGTGLAGRASGLLTFGFYMGFVGSPVLFGLLVDATGSYNLAWSLIGLGFAATVLVIVGWRRSAARASVPASRTA